MSTIEFGTCDICKAEAPVYRKYYYYDIKCSCCNGADDPHFEIVRTCGDCDPKPPRRVSVSMDPMEDTTTN